MLAPTIDQHGSQGSNSGDEPSSTIEVLPSNARRHDPSQMDRHMNAIVEYRLGRILMHVIAAFADREWRFHLAGALREIGH